LNGEGGLPLGISGDPGGLMLEAGEGDASNSVCTKDDPYPQTTTQLQRGDVLLFYTDGVTEARSSQGSFFGEERLDAVMAEKSACGSADAVVAAIREAVTAFSPGIGPADDQTLLAAVVR
jgi:serine phosphatase RsbU (regulator of sigma subunit)